MEIKIDKKVAVPSGRHTYPWREMQPGDSFFVPMVGKTRGRGLYVCARRAAGIEITTRTVVENGVKGIRVWRIDGIDKTTE